MKKSSSILLLIFLGIFGISLFLPGIVGYGRMHTTVMGFDIMMYGWSMTSQGIVGWYANPLAMLTVFFLLRKRSEGAVIASFCAIICALQSFAYQGRGVSFIDSSGPFGTLAAGYYVWLSSLVLLLVISFLEFFAKKQAVALK